MRTQTYELAGFGERFIALVIDTILVSIIGNIIGIGGGATFWGGGIASFILGVAYQWYFLTQQDGQTLGKMIMNLRVIKTDGTQISDADAVLRYVGYLLNSAIMMLGWLWAAVDGNNQGLHDKIANTYVVKSAPVDDAAFNEKAKNEEFI